MVALPPLSRSVEEILRTVRIDDLGRQHDHRVSPDTPLGEVYRVLDEKRHGAVMVCEDDRVVGIFTQRDILNRTAGKDVDVATPIGELMTREPVTLPADRRVAEALEVMVEGGYRHVPLIDAKGREAGLISSRVILRFIADHYPETVLNLPPRLHQQLARPEGG